MKINFTPPLKKNFRTKVGRKKFLFGSIWSNRVRAKIGFWVSSSVGSDVSRFDALQVKKFILFHLFPKPATFAALMIFPTSYAVTGNWTHVSLVAPLSGALIQVWQSYRSRGIKSKLVQVGLLTEAFISSLLSYVHTVIRYQAAGEFTGCYCTGGTWIKKALRQDSNP